jgi:hypothetical protein
MALAHVFFSVEDVVIQVVRLFDVRDALAFVSVRHYLQSYGMIAQFLPRP